METLNNIKFDFSYAGDHDPYLMLGEAKTARATLESRKGAGSGFLGWMDLPAKIEDSLVSKIEEAARIIKKSEALVVVGIGGSYLGARAVIDALCPPFASSFPVYYAGNHLDASYHRHLLDHLKKIKYSVNVISKSGTTTEPGIAFRMLWNDLKSRSSSDEIKKLVFATTDASKGALRKLADENGLTSFVIDDDVGGRFSVLTPVGLLPIAAAGLDIRKFIAGAKDMMSRLRGSDADSKESLALVYASWRNSLYKKGKKIEIFADYSPSLHSFAEWWKQLYGESEGKQGRAIFPAAVDLTTDLHSMGQWMQDGERTIFETVIDVVDSGVKIEIPFMEGDGDGLNYLHQKELHFVNRTALKATLKAHKEGGVPCMRLEVPVMNEYYMGALMYMFEYACGISAYMLGVNPFDQPGVEAYKNNMFQMLGKPGHS